MQLSGSSRRKVRIAYSVLFFFVFADGLAAFACFMVIRDGAAAEPEGLRTAPIRDHGTTYYVTAVQGRIYRSLMIIMVVGIPLVIVAGGVLEVGLGVRVFGDADSYKKSAGGLR